MAEQQLPYLQAYGNITKGLNKIIEAQTPERFTQDYLSTKLGLTGGGAMPVIPFLKRTGFLNPDGSPTPLYNRFRNKSQRGAAAAEALRMGYARLYQSNEYAHDLDDEGLAGLVLQVTGLEQNTSTFRAIIGSFNALKSFATFDGTGEEKPDEEEKPGEEQKPPAGPLPAGVNLGYTINLHLPPTSDVAVFNAIFKSLREHLLR
jgi:uncharacterized protein DUF5343